MRIAAIAALAVASCVLPLFADDSGQPPVITNFVPAVSVAGTGTTNQVAKWTDNAGTLGNSAISEVGGKVGIGTATPGALLHVFGSATSDTFTGMGPNIQTGPAMNFGYSGNTFGRGSGFFNVRPDALAVAPNPSLRFLTVGQQRMIITNVGQIGIGTVAPNARLSVLGEKPSAGASIVPVNADRVLDVTGGDGADGTTAGGGNGGDVLIKTGAGGLGNAVAGNGGELALAGGAGGFAISGSPGMGGKITLTGGAGGVGSSTFPGTGGPITISAGTGGAGGVTFGGSGGTVTINGGDGTSGAIGGFGGAGGAIILHPGAGGGGTIPGTNGSIQLQGNTTITGSLNVTGTLTKGGGAFRIEHPLDPENKYLYHSFVESPDMKNIYDGVAVLDANGEAIVELPEWFEALNRDFRYQLTSIGRYAPVYIGSEIAANRFTIAGGKPGMKVSWMVTGIRHDSFANEHRIPVEEERNRAER